MNLPCAKQPACQNCSQQQRNCFNRIRTLQISDLEQRRISNTLEPLPRFPVRPEDQADLGEQYYRRLRTEIPRIYALLDKSRSGEVDAIYITGLPSELEPARMMHLALTRALGEPFNYDSQNGGELVMQLKPMEGSAQNTNTTKQEFALHTDDAAVVKWARVEDISLYGIENPPETLTGFAPTANALELLGRSNCPDAVVKALFENRYSFRFPISFGFDQEVWSDAAPIISISPTGQMDTRFPSYAIKPVRDDDLLGYLAISAFRSALERSVSSFALNPGCFLTFNNSRGAHKRGAIAEGNRLVLRTYSSSDLSLLRKASRTKGPIFPAGILTGLRTT